MAEPDFTDLNPPDEPPRNATDIVPPDTEDNPERDPGAPENPPRKRPHLPGTDPSARPAVE
jgi:hypothetical protein